MQTFTSKRCYIHRKRLVNFVNIGGSYRVMVKIILIISYSTLYCSKIY